MFDAIAAALNKFTLYTHYQTLYAPRNRKSRMEPIIQVNYGNLFLYAPGNDPSLYLTSMHAAIKAANSLSKLQFIVGNRRTKFHGNYIQNLKVGCIWKVSFFT
jgi:hypothetical protein